MVEAALSDVMLPEARLRPVEQGIYSVYASGEGANAYDGKGALSFYDAVACNPVYNRLVWGYRTSLYTGLCRETLAQAGPGWVLDAGCGSLAFTVDCYKDFTARPVVFLDQSLRLLRQAKARLERACSRLPETMVFLHGDAMSLPFRDGVFGAVVALNLLHAVPDAGRLLGELARVARQGAPMLFTTLVTAGRWADSYLRMWAKAGELVERTPEQIIGLFEKAGAPAECQVYGSLAVLGAGSERPA